MEVAYRLDVLVPAAQYGGSLTANNEEAYNALRWEDTRPKPTWAEILAVPDPLAPLSERLRGIFVGLSVETQAGLGPLAAAVSMFLEQNSLAVARAIVVQAAIPQELESIRAQLLTEFDR